MPTLIYWPGFSVEWTINPQPFLLWSLLFQSSHSSMPRSSSLSSSIPGWDRRPSSTSSSCVGFPQSSAAAVGVFVKIASGWSLEPSADLPSRRRHPLETSKRNRLVQGFRFRHFPVRVAGGDIIISYINPPMVICHAGHDLMDEELDCRDASKWE